MKNLIKNTSPNETFRLNKKLRVKLSGDGTNVGKRLHVMNVTFTILDEGSKAMAAEGNHIIAIIKEPEDYEKLAESLSDIRRDVESLQHINVGSDLFYSMACTRIYIDGWPSHHFVQLDGNFMLEAGNRHFLIVQALVNKTVCVTTSDFCCIPKI